MSEPGAGDVHVPGTEDEEPFHAPKRRLRKLAINRVDLVDRGAHQMANIPLFKRDGDRCPECGGAFGGEQNRVCEDCGFKMPGPVKKREFSNDERQALADKGHAMADGSFPVETIEDLRNAVMAHGRAKDPVAVKAHIIRQARRLGATSALPADWQGKDTAKMLDMAEVDKAFSEVLVNKMGRKLSAKTLASLKAAHDALHETMGPAAHDEEGIRMAKGAAGETGKARTDAEYKDNGSEGGTKSMPDDDDFDDDDGIAEEAEEGAAKGQKGKAAVKSLAKSDDVVEITKAELVELRKQVLAAETIAKAERDARLDSEYVAMAKSEMPGVAVDVLKTLRRLPDAERKAMETQLKALTAQVSAGSLFKQFGGDGAGANDNTTTIAKIEAIAKTAGTSFEDALLTPAGAKLYDEYLAEKRGR